MVKKFNEPKGRYLGLENSLKIVLLEMKNMNIFAIF